MEPNFEERSYIRAKKRGKELKAFYDHVTSYIITIPVLAMINYYITPGNFWFWSTAGGWAIAIVIHALMTFTPPFLGTDWEERKIKEIMSKDNSKNI